MDFVSFVSTFTMSLPGALSQGVLWGIMALGVYITYKILDFPDLTVDGSFALGGAVSAVLVTRINPIFAVILASLAGMMAGVVTGFLHTKLKITGLLAGILTMIALYSVNLHVMGKPNVSLLHINTVFTRVTNFLSAHNIQGIWGSLILELIIAFFLILIMYYFFGTELGIAIRATGDNPDMIRALGSNTDLMKFIGLIFSNGLVGLAGGLVAQNQGFADIQMGVGTIVIGLASVIIGDVIFGRFNFFIRFFGAVAGSIIYRIIMSFILCLQIGSFRVDPNDLKLVTAIIVAAALALPVLKNLFKNNRGTQNAKN
ncbi:MAG: ABC transporter permease [Oscillospiraceae bacterium]|nr:ABC transporter permease [Oscillospiraceae bacterium]